MKNTICLLLTLTALISSLTACKKEGSSPDQTPAASGYVSGKVTDAAGNALAGVKITIEHTVWANTYVLATSDNEGNYKVALPEKPAGSWTAKAQVEKAAYGQHYTFDLDPNTTDAFTRDGKTFRNFCWKLSGHRPDAGYDYGAHADLYQFGTDVPMTEVKLIFSPYGGENTLIDGSTASVIERKVEDIAGTFTVKDIPVGKYTVKAIYPGKNLLLDNRHDNGEPAGEKPVVFGKYGYLGETEYNIEFWLSE